MHELTDAQRRDIAQATLGELTRIFQRNPLAFQRAQEDPGDAEARFVSLVETLLSIE